LYNYNGVKIIFQGSSQMLKQYQKSCTYKRKR